jgi:hypothetical protein
MKQLIIDQLMQLWLLINRVSSYAMMNLLDDPALLAMAFC